MAEQNPTAGRGDDRAEEDKRRRRLVLCLLFGAAILVLFLLFAVCSGGGEDDPVAVPVTSTAAPAAAPPTTAPATLPPATAPPTTTPVPTTQPAATTTAVPTTQPPATTTTEPGPIDVSGVWTFLIDVTEAKGICSGETDEKVEPDEVTIRQEGVTLTVTGLNATDPAWQGEIVGNTVTFGGERDEDRGPTTALFILTVDDDATTLAGIEEWGWTGPGGSCPGSLSEVTAERP